MQDSFEVLESRVRKAADLVQRLRGENARLNEDLDKTRKKLADAEKRMQSPVKPAAVDAQIDKRVGELDQELAGLRREREEIRGRIEALVTVLDEIE
jgi:predicted RNase H-like nuclease (RuvC/YqgF family)